MPLTTTSHILEFSRPPPESATFAFQPPSEKVPSTIAPPTLITFQAMSTIGTQLHWHVTHTEYLKVVQGAALVMVSGVTKIYTKDDGIVTVPRYARHEWMRFDRPASLLSKSQRAAQEAWIREQGEEVVRECKETHLVVKVWTEPGDGQKEIFFRNFFSAIGEPQYKSSMLGSVYTMLTIMCVMWSWMIFSCWLILGGGGVGGERLLRERLVMGRWVRWRFWEGCWG